MNANISLKAFRREIHALPDPALSSAVYLQRLREWEDTAKATGEEHADYFELAASGNFGVLPLADLYAYANRARCALLYRAARSEHVGVSLMPRLAGPAVERIDRALVAAANRATVEEWAGLPYKPFRDLNLFVMLADGGDVFRHRGRIERAKSLRRGLFELSEDVREAIASAEAAAAAKAAKA